MSEPRPRVLLVEDDDAVRDILWESLEQADFAVDTAQTAAEGVEKLATRRYAAIATDCVLPDLTPLDWMVALRGAAPVTPLVLYSGTVTSDDLHLLGRDWAAAPCWRSPSNRHGSWRPCGRRSRSRQTRRSPCDDGALYDALRRIASALEGRSGSPALGPDVWGTGEGERGTGGKTPPRR